LVVDIKHWSCVLSLVLLNLKNAETLEENFLEPHLHAKEVGSCLNSENWYTRMPQSLIAGAGMVVGVAQFLSQGELCTFYDYVVASETVKIIELVTKTTSFLDDVFIF